MKHTIDNIFGACGLLKEKMKKGIKLTPYTGYEAPDGVKISYEVNTKGPFIIHVEIDRDSLGKKAG